MQSETEGSVAAGLVRSAMERRFVAVGLVRSAMENRVGGWACEIGDGEKGLWRLGL